MDKPKRSKRAVSGLPWRPWIHAAPASTVAPRELQGVDPAADPVARFQDDDLDPGLSQRAGEREPGDPRADDQRAIGGGLTAG
jgi:hypothetical protein